MEKNKTLLESVTQKVEFKRKFSLWELYRAFIFAPRAILKFVGNNKNEVVDKQFIERLQLAVTEVTGCAVCSYQHTKMALKQGMSNEEISSFLSGDDSFIKPEEAKAILFAQHFADSSGFPKKYAYDSLIKEYGAKKARIILSAIQVVMIGNMYRIPLGAFLSRLKGNPYKDSTLFYELRMLLFGLLCFPIGFVHGILRGLIRLPNIWLDKSTAE